VICQLEAALPSIREMNSFKSAATLGQMGENSGPWLSLGRVGIYSVPFKYGVAGNCIPSCGSFQARWLAFLCNYHISRYMSARWL